MTTMQIQKNKIRNESEKKGGPYTKKEQEERRQKVYELYFEKGINAITVANQLGVNRNTINSDIKYWLGNMAAQIGSERIGGILLKQIERLEFQRRRLLDELEKQKNFSRKLLIEKILFEIDYKIGTMVSKITDKQIQTSEYLDSDEISDEEISEIVKYLLFNNGRLFPESYSKNEMLKGIIKMKKSDLDYAKKVVNAMKSLGLETCEKFVASDLSYDLFKFATLRGYVTNNEVDEFFKKREDDEKENEMKMKTIEQNYKQKYGNDKNKWPPGKLDEMEEEIDQIFF